MTTLRSDYFTKHKELSFRLSTGYGGACSLTTFANIFDRPSYLGVKTVELANKKSIGGLLFSEEVLLISDRDNYLLEPALLIPSGISYTEFKEIIEDIPKEDEAFVYFVRSLRDSSSSEEKKGHRFAIVVTREEVILVDSAYDHSYICNSILHLFYLEKVIVGIDILVSSETRSIKVFKKDELQHILQNPNTLSEVQEHSPVKSLG